VENVQSVTLMLLNITLVHLDPPAIPSHVLVMLAITAMAHTAKHVLLAATNL
jgi:hypothetical protein